MNTPALCNYLSRLLGRPIASDELVNLSSGQRARLSGWLAENGVPSAISRSNLSAAFRPAIFFDSNVVSPGEIVAAIPESVTAVSIADSNPNTMRIGIDIQRIDELFDAKTGSDLKGDAALRAMFTLREISYAQTKHEPFETLAGLFAAKEALRKCGVDLLSRTLHELEILPDANGRPIFQGYALSISHSGGFAIAVAAALQHPAQRASDNPATVDPAMSTKLPLSERRNRTNAGPITGFIVAAILLGGGVLRIFGVAN